MQLLETIDEHVRGVERILKVIPPVGRVAFAASCAEKLLPEYLVFHRFERDGHPEALRKSLDLTWNYAKEGPRVPLKADRQALIEISPEIERYSGHLYVTLAENAVGAIVNCIDCMQGDADYRLGARNARLCLDSVVLYLQVVNDPIPGVHEHDHDFDSWLLTTPMYKHEVSLQLSQLDSLRQAGTEGVVNVIEKLKSESQSSGINSLLRGLFPAPSRIQI